MESETVLSDLELPWTFSTNQADFENLVESKCKNSVLTLSSEFNISDPYQENISQSEQKPIVIKNNALVNGDSISLPVPIKENIEPSSIESNYIVLDHCIDFYTNSIPGTSSESENQPNLPLTVDDYKEPSTEPEINSTSEDISQNNSKLPKRERRKRKIEIPTKPTRESQRKRKCRQVMNYTNVENKRNVWTMKDKAELLEALQQFGTENIKALFKKLPHKSENDIANKIKLWKDFAYAQLQKKLMTEVRKTDNAMVNSVTRLDEWIQHFATMGEVSPKKLFALSNVFILIAEYGEFPPPSECGNIDFRAMYRYIHCMLNGLPYYGLNEVTANVLDKSLTDLFTQIRENESLCNMQKHLYNSLQVKPICYTYGRPAKGTVTSKNVANVVNLPDVNPLNIPLHLLARPKVDRVIDEDDYDNDDIMFINTEVDNEDST